MRTSGNLDFSLRGGGIALTRFNKFNFVLPENQVKIKQSVSPEHRHQLRQYTSSTRHNRSGSRNRAKREKFLGFGDLKIPTSHDGGITHLPLKSDIKGGEAFGKLIPNHRRAK